MLICNVPRCYERATGDFDDPGHGCRCEEHAYGRTVFSPRYSIRRIDPDGTVREVRCTVPVDK